MATNDVELSTQTRETLERNGLSPLWEIAEEELGQTRDNLEPDIWKWEDVRRTVDRVAEDVPEDVTPRVTVPVNATYDAAISHTISVGVEAAPPGDTTPAHRHSGHFFRFGIDGHQEMKTAVGGEEFPLLANDLITIPQWVWHGHGNESDDEAVWLVVDDSPLRIDALNVGNLYEPHDEERQPITRSSGYHEYRHGACRPRATDGELPGEFEGIRDPTPPYRFAWSDTADALEYAEDDDAARSQYDGRVLSYTNPATGSDSLFPTVGVRAQRLLDGEATAAHSHNATEIFYVIEGSGRTTVDGDELEWSERDIFVVPTYRAHDHTPDGDATLLAVTDRPMLEAINCYHEFEPE